VSKREARLARQAALEAKKGRNQRIRLGAIGGVAVVVVVGIVWFAASRSQPPPASSVPLADVVVTEIDVPNEGAGHIPVGQRASYTHFPPSSGPHWSQAALAPVTWGFYTQPVEPEQWVHNLEHGGVVVLYNCAEDCPETVEGLQRFAAQVPNSRFGTQKIVVSPNAEIETKIVALAWTREMDLSDFDEARLVEFYKRWVDTGPEQVP